MQSRDFIEELVLSELKSLCITCKHARTCIYHANTGKNVLQCELYETGDHVSDHAEATGLCKTCEHASNCKLSGRLNGVWHCNEYS
jgi:hypothetical protein